MAGRRIRYSVLSRQYFLDPWFQVIVLQPIEYSQSLVSLQPTAHERTTACSVPSPRKKPCRNHAAVEKEFDPRKEREFLQAKNKTSIPELRRNKFYPRHDCFPDAHGGEFFVLPRLPTRQQSLVEKHFRHEQERAARKA